MKLKNKEIKEILLNNNYISEEDIKEAEKFVKTHQSSIVSYLFDRNLITKDILGQAIAESFGLSYSDLNSNQPTKEQVLKIPEDIAKQYRVVFFRDQGKTVIITTDNPKQNEISKVLGFVFKSKKLKLTYSLPGDIDDALLYYRKPLETRFSEIIKSGKKIAPELINEIIEDALSYGSSDIHLEPREEKTVVRFRIDGVLHRAGEIPKDNYQNILNRIKIKANLRIDEHSASQDGSIHIIKGGRSIDMRVSIVPVLGGEKTVIRLLFKYVHDFTFSGLGVSLKNQGIINRASHKPFGMILAVGPTGSGKTTTLYTTLKKLNSSETNITTIEDPVEYKIKGLNQIQVNPATNLTFAQGLRSIIRQDPDIILVGEIRDEETAKISVNAALTGHLLFSSFHSNNASTTIPRLLDMGIESFLLSSTLELIIAQRLVRTICEECRYSYVVKKKDFKDEFPEANKFFKKENVTLYKGKGCPRCANTGYKGRTAIFELISVTQEMKELILKNPSANTVQKLARKQGFPSLFEDGIRKVKNGTTTLEEVLRVAKPDK